MSTPCCWCAPRAGTTSSPRCRSRSSPAGTTARHRDHRNNILASLSFSIGFIALTLANSELFTENFLVPIAAVATNKAKWRDVARLWGGTATMNLVGGLVMAALIITAFPQFGEAAGELGGHFVDRGIGLAPFLGSVLAGIIITLMTWMQSGTDSPGARLLAAIVAAFLLSYGELGHVVVASVEMFAGIIAGSAYGWGDWFPLFWQMALGNMVGGIGLVTVLRLVQIGSQRLDEERATPTAEETEAVVDSPLIVPEDRSPAEKPQRRFARSAGKPRNN